MPFSIVYQNIFFTCKRRCRQCQRGWLFLDYAAAEAKIAVGGELTVGGSSSRLIVSCDEVNGGAPKFTGDNGAMVAGLAFYRRNVSGDAALRADASPSLQVGLA